MSAATKSFTATGAGPEFLSKRGETFSYALSGTFVATIVLETFIAGGWTPVVSATIADSGTITPEPGKASRRYRYRCSAFTSGTAVTTISELTSQVLSSRYAADTLVERTTKDGLEILSPKVTTARGVPMALEATFTETTGAGVYTGSLTVPAGATIHDIVVNGVALWNPVTSATLKVGDVADDDGYFTGVDLKATDLLAGESLSFALAGGKAGAYIANSQVSPRYSATARVISGIITTVGASGTTGRTRMTVLYSLPVTADIVAATKV